MFPLLQQHSHLCAAVALDWIASGQRAIFGKPSPLPLSPQQIFVLEKNEV
jgi:hypothetical protein